MGYFLSDECKIQKMTVKGVDFLNFVISQEKCINKSKKKLVDSKGMSEETLTSETGGN